MADDGGSELTATVLPPPDGSLAYFDIVAAKPDAEGVIVDCFGLAGNQPKTYGNTIALWGTSAPRPDGTPLAIFPFPDDNQPSSFPLPYAFSPLDYVLTYQVGASLSTMCGLTPLKLFPTLAMAPNRVSMQIRRITTTSIQIQYAVLPGYQPARFGNWIGLWQGIETAYGAPDPIGEIDIAGNQAQGIVTIAGLDLYSDFDYTLFHFMAPKADDPVRTTAGAALYFST